MKEATELRARRQTNAATGHRTKSRRMRRGTCKKIANDALSASLRVMAGPATKTIPKPLKSPAVPWIVLLGGLALSVIVAISVWTELKRQDRARFERLKERVFVAMDGRFRA